MTSHQDANRKHWYILIYLLCSGLQKPATAFLLPSSGTNAKNAKLPPQSPPDELRDAMLGDLANSLGSVLTGMGAGIGAWTALSGPLQKDKSKWQPWQNVAASFTLLAAGASAEATAIPLWVAASAAGFLATQDQKQQKYGSADNESSAAKSSSFVWSREQPQAQEPIQQTVVEEEDSVIWVEDELGLLQNQAAHLIEDVTVAVDRLYEEANAVSSYSGGGGSRNGYNGPSPYSTGYAAGSKPLYFSPGSRYDLTSQKPSSDAISDFVTELDAAFNSLQKYTPDPYLISGVDEQESAPRMTTVPLSGNNPFRENQFNPTSWAGAQVPPSSTGFHHESYLDELNDGGVMAIPSYESPHHNGESFSPEKTISVPGRQEFPGSFAPTPPNVKGISGVSLAQAGSYLEQLKDAAVILPSFANGTPERAPKMSTVPGPQSFAQDSFAPTKSNVKEMSSKASGYLEQLKGAVAGLASLSVTEPRIDDPAAPKMTTVPMGKQKFHRESFAPTPPSVKSVESFAIGNYLSDLSTAVGGLSSFVNSVSEAIIPSDEPPAPKMTTVPAKRDFSPGTFAPTKSCVKNLSATSVAQAGGYLDQLMGAVAGLSSFADSIGSSTLEPEEEAFAAPKMTTVPMGTQSYGRDSFAPTKASVKDSVPATPLSGYLENLSGAVTGLTSFVEVVSKVVTEEERAPRMTTVPGQTSYAQDSYAPTKSTVKDISSSTLSQASSYLDQLEGAALAISSFVGVNVAAPEDSTLDPAPKMTTIPMGKQKFHRDSFAPTQPSVRNLDSSSMTSYINELGKAVTGLSSFVDALQKQAAIPEPAAPKMTTVPMGNQKFNQDSFAPTKPCVKGISSSSVSQAGGYLETLKGAITALSSFAGVATSPAAEDAESTIAPEAPKMTTVPLGKKTFSQDSFAPTRPSVKDIDSRTLSSYLDDIGRAAMGLSSFVDDVNVVIAENGEVQEAPKMTTVPLGKQVFRQESYAPTRPDVKNISSTSVNQAGGYLDTLKGVIKEISYFADIQSTPIKRTGSANDGQDDVVAPKMTTVPMGKQTFHQASFAPTQPSVKNFDSGSMASYVNNLGAAVDGLSSFVETVGELLLDEEKAPKMTTVPVANTQFPRDAFAPTKSEVKGISSTTVSQAGGYLDSLKNVVHQLSSLSDANAPQNNPDARLSKSDTMSNLVGELKGTASQFTEFTEDFNGLSDHLEELNSAVGGMEEFVNDVQRSLAASEQTTTPETPVESRVHPPQFSSMPSSSSFSGSFAPTKSEVKGLSSSSVIQAGGYLDKLRDAVFELSSLPEIPDLVDGGEEDVPAPKMTTVPMGKQTFSQSSFAPTKSNVKNLSSESLSAYLNSLGGAVQGISSFVESVHEVATFSSMPARREYEPGSYSPTKPSVKNVSSTSVSQAGGYLDQLKDSMANLQKALVVEQSTEHTVVAPKMTTIPIGKQTFKEDSYAPTKPTVKNTSSQSLSAYLESLSDAVRGLKTFVSAVDTVISTGPTTKETSVPFSSMPKPGTFAPATFAPTKPTVKGVSSASVVQAGGYLEALKDVVSGISSISGTPTVTVTPDAEIDVVAPKMTTVPLGKKVFHQSSFAPTKPDVKNVVPNASLSGYLDNLGEAVEGLSTFIQEVNEAVPFSSMPKSVSSDGTSSYAPTKPGVKGISSSSVAQAGGYLDTLRSAVFEMSSVSTSPSPSEGQNAPTENGEGAYSDVAPKMTTVPMGKKTFMQSSFAPTKSSVKNVIPSTLPSYLDDLHTAVSGLSSFVEEVAESVAFGDDGFVAPRMTTMPAASTVFKKGAFAPTKASVKDKSGQSPGSGNYLDALKNGLESLRGRIDTPSTVSSESMTSTGRAPSDESPPKMTTIPAQQTNLPPEGYAPTKSSIKSQSAKQAGGMYLNNLKHAVNGLSSFVDAVNGNESTAALDELQANAELLTPLLQQPGASSVIPDNRQPVLDSAVSTLNEKLTSLSTVVAELSKENDRRNKHLESKVDDLADTVRALNQSVSNLTSCIQALNEGFSGLMTVAERLQDKSLAP